MEAGERAYYSDTDRVLRPRRRGWDVGHHAAEGERCGARALLHDFGRDEEERVAEGAKSVSARDTENLFVNAATPEPRLKGPLSPTGAICDASSWMSSPMATVQDGAWRPAPRTAPPRGSRSTRTRSRTVQAAGPTARRARAPVLSRTPAPAADMPAVPKDVRAALATLDGWLASCVRQADVGSTGAIAAVSCRRAESSREAQRLLREVAEASKVLKVAGVVAEAEALASRGQVAAAVGALIKADAELQRETRTDGREERWGPGPADGAAAVGGVPDAWCARTRGHEALLVEARAEARTRVQGCLLALVRAIGGSPAAPAPAVECWGAGDPLGSYERAEGGLPVVPEEPGAAAGCGYARGNGEATAWMGLAESLPPKAALQCLGMIQAHLEGVGAAQGGPECQEGLDCLKRAVRDSVIAAAERIARS